MYAVRARRPGGGCRVRMRGLSLSARRAVELVEDREGGLGTGADLVVLGQVHPADGAGGIDEELPGPGDHLLGGDGVDEVVAADSLRLGVAQEGVGQAQLANVAAGDLRRVDADGDRTDAASRELGEVLLETP